MSPLFSMLPPLYREDHHQHIELQMLPDEDLMDIWEQAQRTVWMLDEKGWDSAGAIHYCEILLWEMQRRQVRRPLGSFFGEQAEISLSAASDAQDQPRIITIQV